MEVDLQTIAQNSRASIEKKDLHLLLCILAEINPQIILEIGMHQGYSMEVWKKAFDPRVLIGVEKDPPTSASFIVYDSMFNRDSHDPDLPKLIEHMIIKSQVEKENGRYTDKADFLFIDGDHSREGVVQDFEMYYSLVRKGGIIALHDVVYTSDDPDSPVMVKPLWDGLKQMYPFVEIKASEKSTGIGVLFV